MGWDGGQSAAGAHFINSSRRLTHLNASFWLRHLYGNFSKRRNRGNTEISLVAIAFSVVCKVSIEFSSGKKMQQLKLSAMFENRSAK